MKMDNVNHSKPILTYPIASGEMYYEVVNQRTVYLQGDPETGFSLYGEIPGWGEGSSVNLAQILLEFATTWNATGDAVEARRQMQRFGKRLGEALVQQRATARPVNGVLRRVEDILEDVFCSMGVPFARHRTNGEVCYQLGYPCPLHRAAEVTTSEQEIELAHHALNAICQHVVEVFDPKLRLRLLYGPNVEQVISVVAPTSSGRRRERYGTWASQVTGQRHSVQAF
jgi:hypothetical protein